MNLIVVIETPFVTLGCQNTPGKGTRFCMEHNNSASFLKMIRH